VTILRAIAGGCLYLHQSNVIHRDLKPANVLIDLERNIFKVCDFGLSRTKTSKADYVHGTPQYAAPELPTEDATNKVDVYSFAIITWEMMYRQEAWSDIQFPAQIAERVESGERPKVGDGEPALIDMMTKCWAADAEMRPTFETIVQLLQAIHFTLGSSSPQLLSHSPSRSSIDQPPTRRQNAISAAMTSPNMPWDDFKSILQEHGSTNPEDFKYCLVDREDNVSQSKWEEFIASFAPLSLSTMENPPTNGFTLDLIGSIVGKDYFFGKAETSEFKRDLVRQKVGGFLFRFSNNQRGNLCLSALHEEIINWRILVSVEDGRLVLTMEKLQFDSLNMLIEHYKMNTLTDKGREIRGLVLTEPCNRNVTVYNTPVHEL